MYIWNNMYETGHNFKTVNALDLKPCTSITAQVVRFKLYSCGVRRQNYKNCIFAQLTQLKLKSFIEQTLNWANSLWEINWN